MLEWKIGQICRCRNDVNSTFTFMVKKTSSWGFPKVAGLHFKYFKRLFWCSPCLFGRNPFKYIYMHLQMFKFACIYIMHSWEGCKSTFSFVYHRRRSYVVWMPVTSSCVWCIRTTSKDLYIDRCGERCNYEWMEWFDGFNII